MSKPLSEFLSALDHEWKPLRSGKQPLRILGAAALMLQAGYERGTKDGDVLDTAELDAASKDQLLRLAGHGTDMHRRHRFYIDIVSSGLPFLPQAPLWYPLDAINRTLRHLEIHVLDVTDVVVSKLKRFAPSDRADVEAIELRSGRFPSRAHLVGRNLHLHRFGHLTYIETHPQQLAPRGEWPPILDNLTQHVARAKTNPDARAYREARRGLFPTRAHRT